MEPRCRVFETREETIAALAEDFAARTSRICQRRGCCAIAVSGGSTPTGFYRLLAENYRDCIPWHQLALFFSDERFVPPKDPASNYRLLRETLLDQVAIPEDRVFPMPTVDLTLQAAARSYEAVLLDFFAGPPRLDWVLLGLGEDGHTASLFPGFEPPENAWVAAVTDAPKPPPERLTLTYRTFNRAAVITFLVSGAAKAEIVTKVFTKPHLRLPAQRIRPRERLCWFLDRPAAHKLGAD